MIAATPPPPPVTPPPARVRATVSKGTDTQAALTRRRKLRATQREWQAMTPAQKEARARAVYNRTWEKAAKLYGAKGTPPPEVRIDPSLSGAPATTLHPGGGKPNYVVLGSGEVNWLAKPRAIQRGERAEAKEDLLHEWAHVYQDPALLRSDPNHYEEAAELFGTYYGHKLFGSRPMDKRGPLPYTNRPASSRDLASIYGKGYWRRGQFGSNYGKNPASVYYE